MTDKELWLADRIVLQYGEPMGVDFVSKLVSIAEATPKDRRTLNTKMWRLPCGRGSA